MKILVVEDDNDINQLLYDILSDTYETTQAYSGTEAIRILNTETFNLILLDLMLPGLTGQDVISRVREYSSCPIIVISALTDINNMVHVLDLGADDYINKPFDNREVLARVTVQLRKHNIGITPPEEETIALGSLTYSSTSHQILCNTTPLDLTQKELELLLLFMRNPNRVFTKAHLYESVWNDDYYGDDNTLSVHISHIRKHLSDHTTQVQIETIWGLGFKLKI